MVRCDVVIVNFNAGAFLHDAVESVLRCGSVAHVYVVDNASTDGSLDRLPQGHDNPLTIIRNATNRGFSAACNLGLRQAACENVLLLNPDCQVMQGAIDRLIANLRSTDRAGIAGPLLLNPDGSEQAGGRRLFPTPSLVLKRASGLGNQFLLHQEPLPERTITVDAISGACMMVRRKMIEDIGLLDEEYFLHVEDLNLCMRAWRGGWEVLFVPDAKVVHYKGVSSRARPLTVEYHKHKGMTRFYDQLLGETYPRWSLALLRTGIWIRYGGVAALQILSQVVERVRRRVQFQRKA